MSSVSQEAIYHVSKASFSAGGSTFDVSTVILHLRVNSIPTCDIGFAPANANGQIRINSLDLVSLNSVFQSLSKQANELKSASLSLTLTPDGFYSDVHEQTLNLSDWVLVACGLDDVTTTGVFSLSCTIAHPAYRLSVLSGFLFNSSAPIKLDAKGVSNVLEAGKAALEALKKANEKKLDIKCDEPSLSTPMKNPNEINADISGSIGTAIEYLSSLIKWDAGFSGSSGGIPGKPGGEYEEGVKYAMADAWLKSEGDSLWDKIIKVINPWFMTEVIPCYTEKQLKLAPIMPWKEPSVTIHDVFTSQLYMPGFDPNPIYGVIMYMGAGTAPASPSITFAAEAGQGAALQPANLAFIPQSSDKSVGQLVHASDPPWLQTAAEHKASGNVVPVEADGGISYAESSAQPDKPASSDNEDMKVWNKMRMLHMASIFMTSYRSQVSAVLECPLTLDAYEGGALYPGHVAAFKTGGEELFRGQISTVDHMVDCAASRASTRITMNFCDVKGGSSNILGSSPKAPFYP